ncbi:MAG: PAS domain S-box protein, partial [Proteobacteria bacterium]|nr:PAS domain S-box protein [Pseudomonadota bacterium]
MTGYWILGLSIFLQLMAAGLALRLVRVTGRTIAWLLIAGSLLLMAFRRAVVLYHLVATDGSQPIDVQAELVALLISVLMLGGVILIRPYVISLKNSAAAVRESEAIYRGILENMADTYYRTDKNGLITMLSPSVIELLGYSPDELLGKPSEFVYVDSSARQSLLDILSKHGSAKELEALLRHKDGRHILVETSANLLMDSDGNVLGTEGIIRNITRRRQTELISTRMRRIVEDSTNEIYVFDSNTLKFILVNYGARSNLGYSMDELARLTPLDLKPEFSSQQFSELVQPLRDGLLMTVSLRTIHQRKNGTTYPVEVGIQLSLSETPPVFFAII